ncbi:hypothetical protein [Photobacterium lutimaris]|uniref:Uncharacterized protein n=1 Tax=Photobacterium lutimaris TaxID=388278 RepID=A0A2T3ITP6_9GAMM|nr:hypothetical protein [Photobacterium lutimaris]PSU31739.1 hypothetical protein C9I99_21375 [Photobacterium lutimaris]TDR72619.1 hypothetical protein DFP78_11395 [Photobacterium lutimaris]
MQLTKKVATMTMLMPLLMISTLSNAAIESIKNNHSNASSRTTNVGTYSTPPRGTNSIVTQSNLNSVTDLGTNIATTTSSIDNNKTSIATNATNIINSNNMTSSLSTTRSKHNSRITALENRPPPITETCDYLYYSGSGGEYGHFVDISQWGIRVFNMPVIYSNAQGWYDLDNWRNIKGTEYRKGKHVKNSRYELCWKD